MRNFLNAWTGYSELANPGAIGVDEDIPKIKAGNDLLKSEGDVSKARFLYQLALARGNYARIVEAEKQLRKALSNNIYLKGGRREDILMMHQSLHNGHPLGNLEKTNTSKLVATIGLLVLVGFLIRCGV